VQDYNCAHNGSSLWREATTLDPHYDEAFVWLAIAYHKKGDTKRAQAAVVEALRLNS